MGQVRIRIGSVYDIPYIVFTSADGSKWTPREPGTPNPLYAVAYGNGIFVAVGFDGTALVSRDLGATWTVAAHVGKDLYGIVYGGDRFVAVGDEFILSSTNGADWIPAWTGTEKILKAVAYARGIFVAVGYEGMILTSPGGLAWTERSSGIAKPFYGVTYGNDLFVAVGGYLGGYFPGVTFTSPDGIHWTERDPGKWEPFAKVTYGNGIFVAVGANREILVSLDGTWWVRAIEPEYGALQGIL